MLAATAAHDAISALGVADPRIKWPNDILVGKKKIAGILVFARHGETTWVAVSLGVNLESAPDITEGQGLAATSIAEHVKTGEPESMAPRAGRQLRRGVPAVHAGLSAGTRTVAAATRSTPGRPGERPPGFRENDLRNACGPQPGRFPSDSPQRRRNRSHRRGHHRKLTTRPP